MLNGERFAAARAQQLMLQHGRRFTAQVSQEGLELALQGAAAHERTKPVGHIRIATLDSGPPGQTQQVCRGCLLYTSDAADE